MLKQLIKKEKHKWIAELAQDRSFVDIGGLWGTVNETVSLANLSGATKTTMADIAPQDHRLWSAFDDHCSAMGVAGYEKRSLDACDVGQVSQFPKHDFVHCAGVIYHVSDPIEFIQNVASLANEYLILSSMTIAREIKNSKGALTTPVGTAHSVQVLPEATRDIFREYFKKNSLDPTVVDKRPYSELFQVNGRVNTGPWWWLYTMDTLIAWCELCGLEVIKSDMSKNGAFSSVLCRINSVV